MRKTLSLLFLFLSPSAFALSNNTVRVNEFNWMSAQTEHFDVYYDSGTERMVPLIAQYLEESWREVGARLGYSVTERTPFFIYSNHNEFEQTNIVSIGEGTGGVTEAFKNRFLVFNDGSLTWLKHVIDHEFSHVVQFNVLYGGWWKSVRLLKSPFYPLWFMEGMAEYGSGSIDDPTGDMVTRDAVYHKQLPELPELHGFAHLKPNQITLGYKTGEAAMRFLADEYGPDKVNKLLLLMKDHFDISSALDQMLGTDLYRFDRRFHEYMEDKYAAFFKVAKTPQAYGPQLTFADGIPQSNESPVLSPDEKRIYYFSDQKGHSLIYELNVETKRTRALVTLDWQRFENLHTKGRSLSISPDGTTLVFAGEKTQRDKIYFFDIERRRLSSVVIPFDEVRAPVFSPDGLTLACVGLVRGFNDIYLINRQGEVVKRLTDTPQDERDPVWGLDGKSILFSGEVADDKNQPVGRDLFRIDLESALVTAVTNYLGEETEPEMMPDGSIVFVRDREDQNSYGFNLYRFHPQTQGLEKLTNMVGGAFSPRAVKKGNSLYYVGFDAGNRHIYFYEDLPVLTAEPDPLTVPEKIDTSMYALRHWTDDIQSPYITGAVKPYKFQASTDLFLPFLYYSTLDGLVAADIWQGSDMLGNHQIQQQMQYASGVDFLDLAVFYTYARFRPDFTLGFQRTQYYRDFDEQDQRRELNVVGFSRYPLDRVNSVIAGAGITNRKDTYLDESEPDSVLKDRYWITGYIRDTVTGRYLVATRGSRLSLTYQDSVDAGEGNQNYKTGNAEGVNYHPLAGESTLVTRLFYGRSVGDTPQVFRLGGVDRIRGVSRGADTNKKSNVVLSSVEARLRLKYLNARTKFLFPDFFFKAAYLILFDDIGYGWNNREERRDFDLSTTENSAGVGISWPTFILQSYQLNLTVQWAKRTDDGREVWFITVGPTF